ncbi:MAG: phosphoglycerate kinase [Cryobacterium sp.]|nr:phosphoglycerate kinase [Oligoflexia bacterium]
MAGPSKNYSANPSKNTAPRSIRDLELAGKSIFLRLDFNVPLENGKVTDDSRIVEALPTIKYCLEKKARVVIASHLGRPEGKKTAKFSLEPVAAHLSGLLGLDVMLTDDCVGEGIELLVKTQKAGSVILLENLRFHPGEEENNHEFATQLASLCEVYVTDAFGTAHRKHASTYGVPSIMQVKAMGFLIEKELKFLEPLVKNPAKPFYAVLGGSKVTDKIKTVEALLREVDGICIGGAMAHAFWAVTNTPIPKDAKQPKLDDVEAARKILAEAKKKEIPIVLPVDTNLGFDVGPKTVEEFSKFLANGKTIFWNGPLGWFEKPEYAVGTFALAKAVSEISAVKIVGGGDTVSAVKLSGYADGFDHLSTGGGAVLEFIENGTLPGIEILREMYKRETTMAITRERI